MAESQWVTLAHQDDWYEPSYVESCLEAVRPYPDVLLAFTASTEMVEGERRPHANTWVKRAISSMSFLGQRSVQSVFRKRLLLSFGNPIPCPSVMLNRLAIGEFSFPEGWKSNLDWQAWLSLAKCAGRFVYVPVPLVNRTLHADATTTRILTERAREDEIIFRELWPAPIASVLTCLYAPSRRPYSSGDGSREQPSKDRSG